MGCHYQKDYDRMSEEKCRINFLGLDIDALTKKQSLNRVQKYLDSGKYHYQISVNVAKLVYAQNDQKLKTVINNADIINADGFPIYIASKIISRSEVTRMGGYDYIDGLVRSFPDLKYYFLGAKEEVLKAVVTYMLNNHKIEIVGYRNGYFCEDEIPGLIQDINESKADVLLLALGTPAKEYFLYDHRDKLKVKFAVGVGGAFDIIAGKTKRAPVFIQKIGMEWFYRLFQEPRRMWKRYAVTNSIFIFLLFKEFIVNKMVNR